MVSVPFPLSTTPGRNPQESGGRLINVYAEPIQGGRAPAVYRRVPGLTEFGDSSLTGFRGMQVIPGLLFAGFKDKVVSFTSTGGAATVIGTLSGTKPLLWARNNKAGTPDLVAVDVDNGAFSVTASGVSSFADADLPQPNDACFLQGFLFFSIGDGRCFASGLNAVTVDALDFVTAESDPDGLLRCVAFQNQLLLFGPNSCEFFSGEQVNDTGFPFNRVTATPHGLAGRFAIAGQQEGYGRALLWVSNDLSVYMLTGGYSPEKVSPSDLDRLIAAVDDLDTLEATIYVAAGIPRWVLSSPDWTWEFNLNTLKWNERASYLIDRWRGTQAHNAFGSWMIGDTKSGKIHRIDNVIRTEDGEPLRARLESGPVAKFPNRVPVSRIDVDVTVGDGIANGTPNQFDPALELSMSRNGGINWDDPRLIPLGEQAAASQRVFGTRFGVAGPQGPRMRVDVADDVDFGLLAADMSASLRAK